MNKLTTEQKIELLSILTNVHADIDSGDNVSKMHLRSYIIRILEDVIKEEK